MALITQHSVLDTLDDIPLPEIIASPDYGTKYTVGINVGIAYIHWLQSDTIDFGTDELPFPYPVDLYNDFTLEAYYRVDHISYGSRFIWGFQKSPDQLYSFSIFCFLTSPKVTIRFYNAGNLVYTYTSDNLTTWYKCTYKREGTSLKVYVNDILLGTYVFDESEISNVGYDYKSRLHLYGSGFGGSTIDFHDLKVVGYCYTITYDGNGNTSGTPPVDSNEYVSASDITILGQNDLLKTNYYFAGWNTRPVITINNPTDLEFNSESIDSFFDIQPDAFTEIEEFSSDTGQFTEYTEGNPRTFTITGGVGKIINTSGTYGNNIEVISASSFDFPRIFVSYQVIDHPVSSSSYDNIGVGLVKDENNYIVASINSVSMNTRIQLRISGLNYFLSGSSSYSWTSFPFEIGLSLIANKASFWFKNGGVWEPLLTADVSSYYDFTAIGNLTGWRAGFQQATRYSAEWNYDNLKFGYFGGIAMRDQVFITNKDGSTYVDSSRYVYFTATVPSYVSVAVCGIFKMDMNDYSYEMIGIIASQRNSYLYPDLNHHIIIDSGTYRIFYATWGSKVDYGLTILYASTGTSPITNGKLTLISSYDVLSMPGMLSGNSGAYDGMVAYDNDNSRWIMIYSIVDDYTDPSNSNWYPALAYSNDLTTWYSVSIDTHGSLFQYEGTTLVRFLGDLWFFAGGPYAGGEGRIYDKNLVYIGDLDITFIGSGTGFPPHPSCFIFDNEYYVLTFDSTKYGGLNGTQGQPELYKAVDSGGITYHEGDVINVTDDLTLYAIWLDIPGDYRITNSKTFVNRKVYFDCFLSGTDYLWSFGDGATSDKKYAWHEYTKAGVYSIGLMVDGVIIDISKLVIIFESSFILDAGAVYINYGEKNQMILGATEGGNLFGIDEDIRHMTFDTVGGELIGSHRIIGCIPKIIANFIEINYRLLNIVFPGSNISFNSGSVMISRAIRKLLNSDYIKNIAIVAQHGGTGCYIVCKILNAVTIENIDIPFEDSSESVIEITFAGCFSETNYDDEPWSIDFITNN